MDRLEEAREMVVEDPEILSGTPAIRGTRIPIYDVAALVEQGTPISELLEMYPRLNEAKIELASITLRLSLRRAGQSAVTCPKALWSQFRKAGSKTCEGARAC